MVSDICPSGGIGIRARLKIVSRKGCGFDSHLGHKIKAERLFIVVREKANCFAFVRESKDFSVRAERGGKVPADVIGDKRSVPTSGTEIKN